MTERLSESPWKNAKWLVLAPHPDDETIGAGALIWDTAHAGRLSHVVYLTDGSGSHPQGTQGLALARQREARAALRTLGSENIPVTWLGWRDAHPHALNSAAFERSALRLASILRAGQVDALAVSDLSDEHCDHIAAYHLASRAIRLARRRTALFSYHVWGQPPASSVRQIVTRNMDCGTRRRALLQHRSQNSALFGQGFRIPAEMLRMPAQDRLTLRRAA